MNPLPPLLFDIKILTNFTNFQIKGRGFQKKKKRVKFYFLGMIIKSCFTRIRRRNVSPKIPGLDRSKRPY